MIAEKLEIFDFRNIAEAVIKFTPGVNVFLGDNAQGKTNVLEAIYLLAEGKSFRAKTDRELLRFGTKMGGVRLTADIAGRRESLVIEYKTDEHDVVRRTSVRNTYVQRRFTDIMGIFRAVLFCPEHLQLVKGGPAERRSFLDIAICQMKPVYLKTLQRYVALLNQRNRLLKDAQINRVSYNSTNEIWSEQLSECAAYITFNRATYVDELNRLTKEYFYEMSDGRETPEIIYKPSCGGDIDPRIQEEVKAKYFSLYTSGDREVAAGSTLWGTHRDELIINLCDREARLYASQGQDRSLALAMKLSEGDISEKFSGEPPVFLFDDVMSELDRSRRAFLLDHFEGKQIIITSCEPDFFRRSRANIIRVKDGVYTQNGK